MAAAADIMAAAAAAVAGTTEGETVDTDTIMDTMEIMVNPTPHLHLAGNLAVEVPREEFPVVEVLAVALVLGALLVEVPVVAVLAAVAEDAVENSTDLDSMTVFTANRIRQSQ